MQYRKLLLNPLSERAKKIIAHYVIMERVKENMKKIEDK